MTQRIKQPAPIKDEHIIQLPAPAVSALAPSRTAHWAKILIQQPASVNVIKQPVLQTKHETIIATHLVNAFPVLKQTV